MDKTSTWVCVEKQCTTFFRHFIDQTTNPLTIHLGLSVILLMYQCFCSFQAWIVSQVAMPTRNLSKVNTIFVTFFDTFLKFICEYKTLSDAIDDNLAWKVNDCITSISYFTVHSLCPLIICYYFYVLLPFC